MPTDWKDVGLPGTSDLRASLHRLDLLLKQGRYDRTKVVRALETFGVSLADVDWNEEPYRSFPDLREVVG